MRMKKCLPLLLCLLLLTGCSPKELPEGMEEETVIADGQEIVELLVDGDYEEVYGRLRKDVAETTSPENIRELMESTVENAGVYLGRRDSMATGKTVDGEEYGEAVILCEYKKKDVLFRVNFDLDGNMVGLNIQKQ